MDVKKRGYLLNTTLGAIYALDGLLILTILTPKDSPIVLYHFALGHRPKSLKQWTDIIITHLKVKNRFVQLFGASSTYQTTIW